MEKEHEFLHNVTLLSQMKYGKLLYLEWKRAHVSKPLKCLLIYGADNLHWALLFLGVISRAGRRGD